ncbi:single-stranded DNA-binding protein [Borrelia turicatae]|uniref:single-stranded DNA-binding protein n=1 Tax=Borrelia turicatae TaxID=142 RepID=UPI001FF6E6DB|nr:single-stranded DNA-binding protein [Borrelia turicatae]UPA13772.1 single-stranded DNA-binding protein [Borrelia turicatae 91E135]UPA15298.1 single-stranded DNA-binding protein [Borrelia turicatae]
MMRRVLVFDINSLSMSGHLTRDCEITYSSNSLPILKFTLANNRGVRRSNSWERQSQFFDCVLFGSRASSLTALLKRGVQVVLNGSLAYETWTCKRTGEGKSKYSILVNDICVLNPSIKTQETNESKSQDEFYEDIPF